MTAICPPAPNQDRKTYHMKYWFEIAVIWGYIRIMEKKMETTTLHGKSVRPQNSQ